VTPAGSPFLPYGRQQVDDDDIAAVVSVLKGDWLTTGPAVDAFEKAFADYVGAAYAVACSSGTAGLHLAALALGLGPGDEVIVPTMTFLATANAARYVGADVIFADVDAKTGMADKAALETAIKRAASGGAKAIFPVHLNGQCVDMEMVATLAAEHGLAVVEDACHALGTTYREGNGRGEDISVGSCRHSDMAVFSLHPVKAMTMGEGGVVTTNDAGLHQRLLRLRNHGMTRNPADFMYPDQAFDDGGAANPWYYEMSEPGFNYRVSDINCALGLSQLGKLDGYIASRRHLAARYDTALQRLTPHVRPVARVEHCNPAWHIYVVHIDFAAAGVSRATVMRRLREVGIGSQVHYLPVHRQPYYRQLYGEFTLPGADAYYQSCLSLPLFAAMTDADVNRVVEALGTTLKVPHQ
jgi:UDP-4-amino-4,6-dideoxy-N-acetyl-beta-L-altrosamine transaminase